MSRNPDLGLAIWCRLPCFTESITSTAHRCAGHHLRPGTTLYLRENNASREFASVGGWDPKIPRLQGQFPSGWTGTSGPTSGLGQEWSSVRIPNGRICRMIGFQAWWHEYQFVALTRPRGGRMPRSDWANRSIYRSGIYPLNFDRIAPMGCTTS